MLFDTHLHLDDEAFLGQQGAIVERAAAAGVVRLIAVATTAESSKAVVQLAEQFQAVHAAVGIQPNYTGSATDEDWDRIRALAKHPKVVAIGETGLDEYWDYSSMELQRQWFQRHLQLAEERQLPFIVHMREGKHGNGVDSCCLAIHDLIRGTVGGDSVSGVMHSFTGTHNSCDLFLSLGMHISFAGMVTFKNAHDLREVAKGIPSDRILIETDAPYLTPHPFRGRSPNEPAMIRHTAEALAAVRGQSLDAFAAQTTHNACGLFLKQWNQEVTKTI
jgi:TatD DNase family protein